jgi:hypothetical protein
MSSCVRLACLPDNSFRSTQAGTGTGIYGENNYSPCNTAVKGKMYTLTCEWPTLQMPNESNSQSGAAKWPESQQLSRKRNQTCIRNKPEETILYTGFSHPPLSTPQRVLTCTVSPAPTGTSTHEIADSFSISLCAFTHWPFTSSWPNVPGNAARQISAGPF